MEFFRHFRNASSYIVVWQSTKHNMFGVLCINPVAIAKDRGVFLRNRSPCMREFWRKPQKTPKDYIGKRDWDLNLTFLVNQFWEYFSATRGFTTQ